MSNTRHSVTPFCSRWTISTTKALWLGDIHASVAKLSRPGYSWICMCYRLLQCYPARYFRNLEGLEGSETKGFWTAASAHVLCLPSIIVQVFKVLTSLEKYRKIPKNWLQKVRCFPKDPTHFQAVSGGRNLPRRFPEWTKSFPVLSVWRVPGKYLWAAERYGRVSEGW